MRYDGFIESNDGLFVQGWALDFSRPDQPLEVELELSNGWNAVVLADQLRPDLPEHTGQRRHGFRCRLPTAVQEDRSFVVTGRIKGTDFILHRSPLPVRPGPLLEVLAGDIVNNCNLRCPFCIVDYEKIKGLSLMPRDTFERSLALLPLVRDGNFWLSCMHEPTLHPELADYVEAIPAPFRRKVSFTTNFCKRVGEDLLRRLAHSGIHSIRVSVDSLQPELFAQYRKGGRLEVFLDNFRRFAGHLRASEQPPLLHIISMAFKENLAEMPELVRRCRDEFGAGLHEVRFMYYSPHLAEWGIDHIMSMDQWRGLKQTLLDQFPDHRFDLCDPVEDIHARFQERRGVDQYEHPPAVFGGTMTATNYVAVDPLQTNHTVPDEDLRVRMRWDGLLMAEQLPEHHFRVNLLDLPDPVEYFRKLRAATGERGDGVWSRATGSWAQAMHVVPLEEQLSQRDAYIHRQHVEREQVARELEAARLEAEALVQLLSAAEEERDQLRAQLEAWRRAPGWPIARRLLPRRHGSATRGPGPAPAYPFTYYLTTSPFRVFREPETILRGWAFPTDGRAVTGIRVRIDDRSFSGEYGLEEPEVVRVHGPLAQNPRPGLAVPIQLTEGRHRLSLEAQLDGGDWFTILATPIWVKLTAPTAIAPGA